MRVRQRTRRRTGLIPLVLTIAACTGEQAPSMPLRTGTPESVGFSTERLRRVDAALNRWIDEGQIPGAVGLVIRRGTIVYYRAAGFDDPDTTALPPYRQHKRILRVRLLS